MATLSSNAIKVLKNRYLLKNEAGTILESPEALFHRVAKTIAKAEGLFGNTPELVNYWEEAFFKLMNELWFLPNSPTLMNAGTPLNQLSACFVLPVNDTIDSIFTTLKHTALIQQSGGGTGFNFSNLRPKGDFVSTTSGEASGPVSFIHLYNSATENIKQGGKRRGANMGIFNVDHPDIEDFINAKKNNRTLDNFNISVSVSDTFMRAIREDTDWNLLHPNTHKITKTVKAKSIWKQIIDNAWLTGDPGLIFIDTINAHNPTPQIGAINCTNPCGEVPLLPYESCNLGSLNLSKFIKTDQQKATIDWEQLGQIITKAIRFLDNVVETNNYILPEIANMVLGNRKVGLGVMGWAEMLIQLKIPYDAEAAIQLGSQIMQFINEKSKEVSVALAKERGNFPNWEKSIYCQDTTIRNATRTSIAPTGTISIIADTSSSIEPLFALAYKREHVLDGQTLYEINKLLLHHLKENHLYSDKLMEQVMKEGCLKNIQGIPESTKSIFKTSLDIDYQWHIRHQVAFQQHTDNAVSKTINLPQQATAADVEKAYQLAWESGAKGITIFRYGSKDKQILKKGVCKESDIYTIPSTEVGACKSCIT